MGPILKDNILEALSTLLLCHQVKIWSRSRYQTSFTKIGTYDVIGANSWLQTLGQDLIFPKLWPAQAILWVLLMSLQKSSGCSNSITRKTGVTNLPNTSQPPLEISSYNTCCIKAYLFIMPYLNRLIWFLFPSHPPFCSTREKECSYSQSCYRIVRTLVGKQRCGDQ